MDKKSLIKVFKIQNLATGVAITIIAGLLYILANNDMLKGISTGMAIGIWIGVVMNHFVKIPKVFGRKDERQLVLSLIAILLSLGAAFSIAVILFALAAMDAVTFSLTTYFYALAILLITTFAVRFGSYKLLDNYL